MTVQERDPNGLSLQLLGRFPSFFHATTRLLPLSDGTMLLVNLNTKKPIKAFRVGGNPLKYTLLTCLEKPTLGSFRPRLGTSCWATLVLRRFTYGIQSQETSKKYPGLFPVVSMCAQIMWVTICLS